MDKEISCQSCGINAGNSLSDEYCTDCFQMESFTDEIFSLSGYADLCLPQMIALIFSTYSDK